MGLGSFNAMAGYVYVDFTILSSTGYTNRSFWLVIEDLL